MNIYLKEDVNIQITSTRKSMHFDNEYTTVLEGKRWAKLPFKGRVLWGRWARAIPPTGSPGPGRWGQHSFKQDT